MLAKEDPDLSFLPAISDHVLTILEGIGKCIHQYLRFVVKPKRAATFDPYVGPSGPYQGHRVQWAIGPKGP